MNPISTNTKKQQSEVDKEEIEQKLNASHNPFLGRFYEKLTPIGFEYHQVEVEDWAPPAQIASTPQQQLQNRKSLMRLCPTFLASRTQNKELDDYLEFAQNYFDEKIPDYFNQGMGSRQRMRAKALKFLHKMDYNYTKAKFYILFPYYLKYNSYRCHDPLNISIEDMKKKINDHIQGLRNTKQKQMEKWVQSIENCLESRTTYTKMNTLLENGKQNKYQIPDHIKQQMEKAMKAGKQLRKSVQGSKVSFQSLIQKKQLLQEHKILTPEMINFEDTVTRCQEWIKKQEIFMEKYIQIEDDDPVRFSLKPTDHKIEFRTIQLLVSEYNNLPILDTIFEKTIKLLYLETMQLLQKMPTLNKTVKTRTTKQQTVSKIPYKIIREYLTNIEKYPITHEEFVSFEINMRESMELLERLSMFLEDNLSEKTSRILNHYIKLMSDIQIENQVEKKLKIRLQYNDIMDRIKKQLSNPGKVDSIKQALNKLKEKGIKEVEDSGYQQKIMLYLGWYESQQKLKQAKINPSNIQLIQKQLDIKRKLVNAQSFKDQLQSARKQLNISEQSLEEAYKKIDQWKQNQQTISTMLEIENPNLEDMIEMLKVCIKEGLTFPEFQQLYQQIIKYFIIIAKMHYLLKYKNQTLPFLEPEEQQNLFFRENQCDYIIELIVFHPEIKDLRSKQGAYKLLETIQNQPFPSYLRQCSLFKQFMNKGEEWEANVQQMIRNFREKGESIDPLYLQNSKYHIHFKSILDELNKIQFVMRWREKIAKKFDDTKPKIFSEAHEEFLQKLEADLKSYESIINVQAPNQPSPFKFYFLQYNRDHEQQIKEILSIIINETSLQNKCKLSEMNKFYREIQKQIERHKIDDKKIFQLKEQFKQEILIADDWKERYLMIKRFEKKKISKKEQHHEENMIEEENDETSKNGLFGGHFGEQTPDHVNPKKRYTIKNCEFTWYFKFLIMLLEFCKGYKLKFCLEELDKLKSSLTDIHKFITNYDKLVKRSDPTDIELAHLEAEYVKIPIFIRQFWLLNKKNSYVHSWRILADSILESVPIVNMQFKARKQSELIALLAKKKLETQEANKQASQENQQTFVQKRSRKPNKLYTNDDITLLTDENMLGPKTKKRRKGQNSALNDSEYRNTSVSKKTSKEQLLQIQRAEQLLKNSQLLLPNLLFDEEAIREYCICRNGELNENSTMVQCQGKCGQWYHIQCIGIKKHQTKGDYHYICIGCTTLYENDEQIKSRQQGSFYWDYHKKITEYAFVQIVEEGKNLGVQTQQLRKLLIVYQKMNDWKKKVEDILENIARDRFRGKSMDAYGQSLYELYLLSIWLPTCHPQAYTIKRQLMFCKGITY